MSQLYNFYNIEAPFTVFLSTGNNSIKPVSIKNYVSDLRHFFGWAVLKSQSDQKPPSVDEIAFIQTLGSEDIIRSYLDYLKANTIPDATVNRRLSTLKKFFYFAQQQEWVAINPFKHAQFRLEVNEENLFDDFAASLLSDPNKDQVISDIRDFIDYAKGT